MRRAGVDLIILGGGPVVYAESAETADSAVKSLEAELGIPVTTSFEAYKHAEAVLGSQRVGSVTYGAPRGATDHLSAQVVNDSSHYVATKIVNVPFVEIGRISSDVPLSLARELKQEHPEIDTIRLVSPHWACAVIIEPIEKELEVSVLQGSQALLWHALRTLGITDRIDGYGTLLRDH
jgi:maleate isomerase